MLGLHDLELENLDDNARSWVSTLNGLMDDEGISDPSGRGTLVIKAEGFNDDDKFAFRVWSMS